MIIKMLNDNKKTVIERPTYIEYRWCYNKQDNKSNSTPNV